MVPGSRRSNSPGHAGQFERRWSRCPSLGGRTSGRIALAANTSPAILRVVARDLSGVEGAEPIVGLTDGEDDAARRRACARCRGTRFPPYPYPSGIRDRRLLVDSAARSFPEMRVERAETASEPSMEERRLRKHSLRPADWTCPASRTVGAWGRWRLEWSASPWRVRAAGPDPGVGKRSAAARSGAGRFWSRPGARISTDTRRAGGPRADSARQIERRVRHATGGEPGCRQADGNHGRAGGYPIGMGRHGGMGGNAPARAIHWSAGLPGFEGAESLASPGVLHRVGRLPHLVASDKPAGDVSETRRRLPPIL